MSAVSKYLSDIRLGILGLFYLTVISVWASRFPSVSFLNWSADVLILLSLLTIIFRGVQINIWVIIGFIILLLHMVIQSILLSNFATQSLVRLYLTASFFFYLLKSKYTNQGPDQLLRIVLHIYFIHLVFIFLEIMAIELNLTHFFDLISNHSYKSNHSGPYSSVPQSLYNMSQAASMMISTTILIVLYKIDHDGLVGNFRYFLYLFVLMFGLLLHPNYTSIISLLVSIIIFYGYKYLINYSIKGLFPFVSFLLVFWIFSGQLFAKFSLVNNFSIAEKYFKAFSDPVVVFLGSPFFSQTIGFGNVESIVANTNMSAADFGLGVLLLQIGWVLFGLVFLLFIVLFWFGFTLARTSPASVESKEWILFFGFNFAIVMFFIVSMAHYMVVMSVGGVHLFGLHLALAYYARYRCVTLQTQWSARV